MVIYCLSHPFTYTLNNYLKVGYTIDVKKTVGDEIINNIKYTKDTALLHLQNNVYSISQLKVLT